MGASLLQWSLDYKTTPKSGLILEVVQRGKQMNVKDISELENGLIEQAIFERRGLIIQGPWTVPAL